MEFKTIKVNSSARGSSKINLGQEFIEAVKKTLALPIYQKTGFTLDIEELKTLIGYNGSAKTSSLVWCLNKVLKKHQIKSGVREGGRRIAFFKI